MSFGTLIRRPTVWDRSPVFRDADRLLGDRFFREFTGGIPVRAARPAQGFSPRIEVQRDDSGYTVTAELPGFEPDEFEVAVEDGLLTLRGGKRVEVEASAEASSEAEAEKPVETKPVKQFERRFRLGKDVAVDQVNAVYRNGLLTVTLPKAVQEDRTRMIPVTSA